MEALESFDEDAELAAIAARDVDAPHAEVGYDVTTAPRGRRKASGPTFFRIVEVAGVEPARAAAPTKVCRKCNQETTVLHQHPQQPNEPARTICGSCQGAINLERM